MMTGVYSEMSESIILNREPRCRFRSWLNHKHFPDLLQRHMPRAQLHTEPFEMPHGGRVIIPLTASLADKTGNRRKHNVIASF